jgi:hypothetical protein
MSTELVHESTPRNQLVQSDAGPAPLLHMIEKIVNGGVTESNVAALDKLLSVYERLDDKRAEREFSAAFVALQADLPVIVASSVIPNRGKYERFEDVMRVVSPLLVKHGFSVSFSMDFKENRIVETCHLKHVGGHSQSNSFAVRAGGKADSDTQADCKAATTAKRNALLNCLNIVIRQDVMQNEDDDVSLEGSPIPFDKAQYLRELVKDTNSDEASFLKFAGASKYEEILSSKYDMLVGALHRKMKK